MRARHVCNDRRAPRRMGVCVRASDRAATLMGERAGGRATTGPKRSQWAQRAHRPGAQWALWALSALWALWPVLVFICGEWVGMDKLVVRGVFSVGQAACCSAGLDILTVHGRGGIGSDTIRLVWFYQLVWNMLVSNYIHFQKNLGVH